MFFTYLLPWYKERIRGPHLPFEKLEEELRGKSGWPPIGDCKNNEIKIGEGDQLECIRHSFATPILYSTGWSN